MLEKINRTLFLLIVFSISFQVGLHYWPSFSYVSGVRIDYLSPTLYFIDILLVAYILVSLPLIWKDLRFRVSGVLKILLLLFLLSLLLNVFISKSPGAHVFGIVKLTEFSLFAFVVSRTFKMRDIPFFIYALLLSAVFSSLLAVWQFISQASIGGLLYFLGERNFSITTIGISTVNIGKQMLRSYAAFPHPNVLAFFLLMTTVFGVYKFWQAKKINEKVLISLSLMLILSAIIFTFSRTVILLLVSFFFLELFTKLKRNVALAISFITVFIIIFASIITGPNFLYRGVNFRLEFLEQSALIFQNNPYFGIGLNNFFAHQLPLIKSISPVSFQPAHNIFILALLSLGLFAFWTFPALFVVSIRKLISRMKTNNARQREFYKSILFLLIAVIISGTFDHYFLTLEQGQLMFALLVGLAFSEV